MSNTNSKIQIRCDLCGKLCAPQEIKEAHFHGDEFGQAFFFEDPTIDGKHFACNACLERIGWKELSGKPDQSDPSDLSDKSVSPENEKPADTPNAAGSSDNTSPSI